MKHKSRGATLLTILYLLLSLPFALAAYFNRKKK